MDNMSCHAMCCNKGQTGYGYHVLLCVVIGDRLCNMSCPVMYCNRGQTGYHVMSCYVL